MAKKGEEYPGLEGQNVNDWHWTEWNAMEWMKKRADELFKKGTLLYVSKSIKVECESVQWFKGDAAVTNRKKKIGAFWEIELGINIKGIDKVRGTVHYGILEVPYIADEQPTEDCEVRIIRCEGIKNQWLKKKRKYKKLFLLIDEMLCDLKSGACFKERAKESIIELEEKLSKIEERIVTVDDSKKKDV